jgi:DNA topoisomerase-1
MATKLVIVESPTKIKTISKILGKDYIVKSSKGHIRDLPVKRLGVNVDKDFEPSYEVVKSRATVVKELIDAAKKCDEIYLAPDPDREGEAIAWHLQELLSDVAKDKPFFRVQYNEITPRAVKAAFEHPGELDMDRVNAQQARRILDRIVGYKVSPLLWRRVKRGLSAGRVQSVALRLVCEREKEVIAFIPEPYWILGAKVRKLVAPLDAFSVKLTRMNGKKIEINIPELAAEIQGDLDACKLTVQEVKSRVVNRRAYAPFITSTLQQAASTFCGFSPRRTMSVAQKLYEGVDLGNGPEGLITYMRTDSVSIAADALTSCREFITASYGDEYLPETPNVYKSRSGAQEAHEAIRPADVTRTPAQMAKYLDPSENKLYKLIWERFVASQMPPAKIAQLTAVILSDPASSAKGSIYQLQATASETVFPGHRRVSGELEKKKDDSDDIEVLPPLASGEELSCLEVLSARKETKPPPRITEASLV